MAMTKKSHDRKIRDQHNIPKASEVAVLDFHAVENRVVFVKNEMLVNQIYRDGPKVTASFDRYAKRYIKEATSVYATTAGIILRHLPKIDNDELKPTVSRLMFTALNSYTAGIEAARHGYRRQFGILSRSMLEALALVITLMTQEGALERFHKDELSSAKCITFGKAVLPIIGQYYGLLSKDFAHISKSQNILEPPSLYTADQEALCFIINSIKSNIWLCNIVAEFAFHDECEQLKFWRILSESKLAYDPSPETQLWSDSFLKTVTPETLKERKK